MYLALLPLAIKEGVRLSDDAELGSVHNVLGNARDSVINMNALLA